MLVEVGGKKEVLWVHEVEFDREKLSQGADKKLLNDLSLSVGRTICTIKGDGLELQGVTYRSKVDAFDQVKGMKESMRRALGANFSKEERKVFWDALNEMPKGGLQLAVHV